jgi:hypothetical protein
MRIFIPCVGTLTGGRRSIPYAWLKAETRRSFELLELWRGRRVLL